MKKIMSVLGLACLLGAGHIAHAAYPDRPIRLTVPASAGGAADTLARMIGKEMADELGQPVVVENKPGAAAIVGMVSIARSQPDGYSIGMSFAGAMSINPSLYDGLQYDPEKDLEPIAITAVSPLVVAVNADSRIKTLDDLLAAARKEPGKLSYGSTGVGSTQHLSMALFANTTGVELMHVPYKGSAASLVDLQSGLIDMVSDNAITLSPMFQSGKLRPIAVETAERISALPDTPTVAESGFPGYQAAGWYGFIAPAGTPQDVIVRLNEVINRIVSNPSFKQRLQQQGMEPYTDTPEGFKRFIRSEREKWAEVIKSANVPVQTLR